MTETREYIKRDGIRFVALHNNRHDDDDRKVGMVRALLSGALAALEDLPEDGPIGPRGAGDGGAIDKPNADMLRVAYELTVGVGIGGFFPSIIAWTVCRTISTGGGFGAKTVWDACFTKDQAERLRTLWAAKEGKLADRHGWRHDTWTVELGEARLTDLIDPEADIEKRVRDSGAFER